MVVSDLIKASLRKLTVIASGETPTASNMQDGLAALQSMLRSWAGERIIVFSSVKETKTLVGSTSLYTWGSGGTINTTRPNKVLGAFIRDSSGVDHPVEIITEGQYRSISTKATSSRPYALFYHPTFPLGNLYTYPTPVDAETLNLESLKPFTETSSFATLNDTLAFPPNYEEALLYNLAIRLAPEFGKAISIEVGAVARNSYDRLTGLNASNQVESISVSIPAGQGSRSGYNINSDSYR